MGGCRHLLGPSTSAFLKFLIIIEKVAHICILYWPTNNVASLSLLLPRIWQAISSEMRRRGKLRMELGEAREGPRIQNSRRCSLWGLCEYRVSPWDEVPLRFCTSLASPCSHSGARLYYTCTIPAGYCLLLLSMSVEMSVCLCGHWIFIS